MEHVLHRFWTDNRGQDLAEYALLLALLSVVVLAAMRLLGTQVSEFFEFLGTTLRNAV